MATTITFSAAITPVRYLAFFNRSERLLAFDPRFVSGGRGLVPQPDIIAGFTVIPEDQTGAAIGWRFHQPAFESRSNRQEMQQRSAASHKHGPCEH